MIGTLEHSRVKTPIPQGKRVNYNVTSCSRQVGWELCANKHRCDAQSAFFGYDKEKLVFFCEECAIAAIKFGIKLHRIV